ncbi:hypothetical protein JVU11DRAFT_5758 [Chiua virens]|nr:hypothetical protein JVU11DRAFT_5758 [Chiua virens]
MWNESITTPKEAMTALLCLNPLGKPMFVHNSVGKDIFPNSDPTVNFNNWMIKGINGDLASQIFRVQNYGGQPPAKYHLKALNITVKYAAQYCK